MKTKNVLLVYFILAGFGLFACSEETINPTPELPQSNLGYQLERTLLGEQAKEFVNRLHFQSVTENENLIGFYKGEDDQAVIYVTRYPKQEKAQEDFRKMTSKIIKGGFAFTNGEHLEYLSKPVFRCFGMGQTHFVFTLDTQLFWISINTMKANQFLEEYLKYME